MLPIQPRRFRPPQCLAWLAVLLLAATAAPGQDDWDWLQHLRIGLPVMVNIKSSFSENGQFNIPSQAGPVGVTGANHIFNDGYVKVDNTGDARQQTGYWGYDNASQYNSTLDTLTMHSSTGYSLSGEGSREAQPFPGFEAAYGTDLFRFAHVRIGWELGAELMPIHVSDDEALNASVTQSLFTFGTGSIIMPTAPYNGGISSYPEPTISDIATNAGSTNVTGTVTGSRRLEMMLYTVRLGPTLGWNFMPGAELTAGAGPVVGVLTGDYEFSETITTPGSGSAYNSGRYNATKGIFGGYANASLVFQVINHGDVYLGAEFMPLGNVNMNFPGREASLDLRQALQFSAGFNWPF